MVDRQFVSPNEVNAALGAPVRGEITSMSPLEALNRAEVDIQITTAKRYPRSLAKFCDEIETMALRNAETAAAMFYVLERDGKRIEGPSVRMAEIAGSCWGNVRYGSRIIDTDDKFVTAQGTCLDLEKNIAISIEVKRRITGKRGRFSDDMIAVTSNAACSIALRQAILKVIPGAYILPVVEKAKKLSVGEGKGIHERRLTAVEWFVKAGVKLDRILAHFGYKSIEDITAVDLEELHGTATALRDGEITVDEALPARETPKAADASPGLTGADLVGAATGQAPQPVQQPAQPQAAPTKPRGRPRKVEAQPSTPTSDWNPDAARALIADCASAARLDSVYAELGTKYPDHLDALKAWTYEQRTFIANQGGAVQQPVDDFDEQVVMDQFSACTNRAEIADLEVRLCNQHPNHRDQIKGMSSEMQGYVS